MLGVRYSIALLSLVALGSFMTATVASASTIQCCSISSDATPASQLQATFDFQVAGSVLTLTVDNDTLAPSEFNINQIYFDASDDVTSLALDAAAHSLAGDVASDWGPLLTGDRPGGFSALDYSLQAKGGQKSPYLIQPGEEIAFVFTINGGVGSFSMSDFGPLVAAKFVSGPDDPEAPGSEDSAFGTVPVPEPSTTVLLSLGLAGLSFRRRPTGPVRSVRS